MKKAFAMFFVLICTYCSALQAQGVLDFADPCIKGTQEFKSTSQALHEQAQAVLTSWDSLSAPPPELAPLYVEAVKAGLYHSWLENPQTAPLIKILSQADPKFDSNALFLKDIYPKAVTAEQENELVRGMFKADYGTRLRPKLLAENKSLDDEIGKQKMDLDSSCKNGEFDKLFRATVGNFAALVGANFAASANEQGDMAKLVRATSGISITDIVKFGILGGPNSEFNKALNNALGNSDVKKLIKGLESSMDPTKWRFDTPNIPLPQFPKAPNIPLPQFPKAPEIRIPSCCKF